MNTVEIGGTPYEESCAQIGVTESAGELNRLECRAYIAALRVVYGAEPPGAELRIKSNVHDFGTYHEVVCRYDESDEVAAAYAEQVEQGLATWAQAGFWTPVTYHQAQPVHVIRDPAAWVRADNPQARPTLGPAP